MIMHYPCYDAMMDHLLRYDAMMDPLAFYDVIFDTVKCYYDVLKAPLFLTLRNERSISFVNDAIMDLLL
jgi:hypothetical protein